MASLLERMHPRSCTCGGGFISKVRSNDGDSPGNKRRDLHERVAMLLNDIGPSSSREDGGNDGSSPEKKSTIRKRRLAATKSLFKLSNDRDNRVPLLCTSSIDVLPVLLSCLQTSSSPDGKASKLHEDEVEIRRLSCLILNNLSTPVENKAVMSLGEHSQDLLTTLVEVIETASPESHLCVICLYNLSFLDDAVDVLLNFCPGQEKAEEQMKASGHTSYDEDGDTSFGSPRSTSSTKISHHRIGAKSIPCSALSISDDGCFALQNDRSLLRILESMVRTYSPFLLSSITSVEGEAVRWSVGLLCNFCKDTANCPHRIDMILQTELVPHIVTNLGKTPRPMNQWTENSLEEFSLVLLCHLVKVKAGRDALRKTKVLDAIEPIIGKGGIHDHRAGVIRCALMSGEEDVNALSQWRKKIGSKSSF